MSANQKGGWHSIVKTIVSWPISREIGQFLHDVFRHYKLDAAAASVAHAGNEMRGEYARASSRLRFWLKFAIAIAIIMGVVTLGYHCYYNPTIARLLHLPMPVDAVRVRTIDLVEVSGGGGEVQQSATVTLISRISGVVKDVPVNLGDIVTTNSILYSCDTRVAEAALEAAKQTEASDESALKLAERQDSGNQELKNQGLASEEDLLQSASVLAQARANLAIAQEAVVNAQLDLESATTKSPVNGIVLQRLINPSERLITNQTVMQVGDLDDIYFLTQIAEDKIAFVHTGLKADVVFPAFPGEIFTGDVFFIDPKTDPNTRAFTVYIKIANPELRLKPGLSGFARITEKKHVLAVPDSVLINPEGENATVFVITDDNHAVLRPIHFAMVMQGWTEITDGLKEGDIVAAVGPLYLMDGDKVHVTMREN